MAVYNPPKITPFDNGMILVSMRNELLSASQVGFVRGIRNDPPDASGIAHFNEHMFCHGATKAAMHAFVRRCPGKRTPVSDRQANRTYSRFMGGSNGPGINVYTLHSRMGFGHQDLFAPKYLNNVFPVMAGLVSDAMEDSWRMRASDEAILSPKIFKVEHAAVTHETAENDEWPGMLGYREARKLLYRSNPARFEGDSEPEQFANIKLGTVKQWTQQHLVADTLRIIMLGPTRDAAVRLLRETGLNSLPARTAAKPVFDASDLVPSLTGIVRRVYPRAGARMRHVCMLWPTDVEGCRYSLPLEVLARVLKDRVEEALREEAMGVYHPHVDWDRTSTHGFLTIQFSTLKDDAGCEDMVQRTLQVIEEFKRDGSEALVEDVDDSRFYLANSYLEDYHFTPGAFADRILDALSNGDTQLENFNAYYSDILHVSPARVRAAARKYLPTDRFVITTVRPAE